jgi:hypothetical protein
MTRRCSWCGKNLGQKSPFDDPSVTHGVCLPCSADLLLSALSAEPYDAVVKEYAAGIVSSNFAMPNESSFMSTLAHGSR